MAINPAIVWHTPQSVFTTSTTKFHALGTKLILPGGRVFYYGRHSLSTTLGLGLLMTQAAVVANHQNRTATGTSGQKTATLAIGATAQTADQYADGYFWVDSGTGLGQHRIVVTNAASAGSTTETYTLDEPLITTLAATPTGSVQKNLYADLVVHPGNAVLAGCPVGIINVAVAAGDTTANYMWIQTAGPAAVSVEGSVTAGLQLTAATAATSDAGQFKAKATPGTGIDADTLAWVIGPNGTDEHRALVDLRIKS
jgi:hypothetical protein